jgi:hypothetical protein
METKYFIEKAIGISVIHLCALYKEKESNNLAIHSPMDYHIHNLFYFDKSLKHAGGICLDTSDLQTNFCETEDYLGEAIRNINMDIAKLFIEKVDSLVKAKRYDRRNLFARSDQQLWDMFNSIKEATYIYKLKQFVDYIPANTVKLAEQSGIDLDIEPDMNHKWAEVRFTEERFIKSTERNLIMSQ